MWYKLIIIYIPNQRLSILHAWFTTLAHPGPEAIFFLQIRNLLIKSNADSVSKVICFFFVQVIRSC